ncbi:hypothetical protein [Escherichia phage CR01]|nr:hypothetical protein [Escherichia phage CR01]
MILKERGGNNDVHALLSPSGAKKWLACSASLACEKIFLTRPAKLPC